MAVRAGWMGPSGARYRDIPSVEEARIPVAVLAPGMLAMLKPDDEVSCAQTLVAARRSRAAARFANDETDVEAILV